jgi:anti-sigma B factor antagonist
MTIEETVYGNVVIIEPKGRLTVEIEEQFRDTVRRLLESGRARLVLNLASVPYIDSCGLGAIVQAYVSARRHGGDLKLLNVSGRNHRLLTITKLLTVFETYDSEDEVGRSFGATRLRGSEMLSQGRWEDKRSVVLSAHVAPSTDPAEVRAIEDMLTAIE